MCDCQPDPYPPGDGEDDEPCQFLRTCPKCGYVRYSNHCPHDGYQRPCSQCGTREQLPDP